VDQEIRSVLLIFGVLALLVLGGALLACASLSDLVHWTACQELLGFTTRTARSVSELFGW
jgi:hypothetical protein